MAHLLSKKKNGDYSFASHGLPAWHGLGKVVENAMTFAEVIELADLGYTVEKRPIYYQRYQGHSDPTGTLEEIPGTFATVRTDNNDHLGVVKSRYEIVQNMDCFGFFDEIIDRGEAIYETAGSILDGARMFVAAKLPNDILVKGEPVEKYCLLTNSHDGSSGVVIMFTNIRVVCNNTLQVALGNMTADRFSVPHVLGAKNRLKMAHDFLGVSSAYMTEVGQCFGQMADARIDRDAEKQFFFDVMDNKVLVEGEDQKGHSARLKNVVDVLMDFSISHETQQSDAARGTVWGAYNAVSGYFNYCKGFDSPEQKFVSLTYNGGNRTIRKAFTKAMQLV
jgi:phage/plasmid-like protein (TIGR03299 family)